MYIPKVNITLTQEADGSFRVQSLINTVQLSIGQTVERDRVERWITLPNVTVRISGLTATDEQDQAVDLLSDKPAQKRSKKLEQSQLSIAK